MPQRASFSAISTGDINLWRTLLTFRTFFTVAAAAAAVTVVLARFSISVAYAFIIIFRRGFQQINTFPSPLLFNQLKRTKEKESKKTERQKFINLQKAIVFTKKKPFLVWYGRCSLQLPFRWKTKILSRIWL
jgi:hypothetical protein